MLLLGLKATPCVAAADVCVAVVGGAGVRHRSDVQLQGLPFCWGLQGRQRPLQRPQPAKPWQHDTCGQAKQHPGQHVTGAFLHDVS